MNSENDSWHPVCKEDEIDMDDLIRFDFEESTYCIYRIEDGFYATDGICSHEAVHLEDGLVMDGEIECPMHQGIFDIKTGKAKSAPACIDLKTYPVKSEDGNIFIQINSKGI